MHVYTVVEESRCTASRGLECGLRCAGLLHVVRWLRIGIFGIERDNVPDLARQWVFYVSSLARWSADGGTEGPEVIFDLGNVVESGKIKKFNRHLLRRSYCRGHNHLWPRITGALRTRKNKHTIFTQEFTHLMCVNRICQCVLTS